MKKILQGVIIGGITLLCLGHSPSADVTLPSQRRAEIIEIEGRAEVREAGADVWKPAEMGREIRSGDSIRTQDNSYLDLSIEKLDLKDAIIRIREKSVIKMEMSPSEITIEIITGKLAFWAEKIGVELAKFEIRTPNTIVGIEGSHGVVSYDAQSDMTESWLKVSGGYVVNIPSGMYERLTPGANYVESRKEKTKIEKELKKKIYSYDLKGFGGSYAFAKRMEARRRGTAARYGKDYLSGLYRTQVEVSDGLVGVAPYDVEGPRLGEEVLLYPGERITMEDEILITVIEKEQDKKEPPGPSKKKEEEKEKEEDVKLELDETLDEAQEPLP